MNINEQTLHSNLKLLDSVLTDLPAYWLCTSLNQIIHAHYWGWECCVYIFQIFLSCWGWECVCVLYFLSLRSCCSICSFLSFFFSFRCLNVVFCVMWLFMCLECSQGSWSVGNWLWIWTEENSSLEVYNSTLLVQNHTVHDSSKDSKHIKLDLTLWWRS